MPDSKIEKVGIVVNQAKTGARELLTELRKWFQSRKVQVFDTTTSPLAEWIDQIALLVCLGGDGTLLSVVGPMKHHGVPVLGVNLGSLGFLTEVKQHEVFEELELVLEGRCEMESRFVLACRAVNRECGTEQKFTALNDVVISREGLTRILRLSVQVSGEKLTRFSGDGVIVATPTGSTAYSLSAGGAVVHPKLAAMVITPICPHASSLRPMVVSGEEAITVVMEGAPERTLALLTVDGQEDLEINHHFYIEIKRSDCPVRLIKSSKRGYFSTLRENFKFPD